MKLFIGIAVRSTGLVAVLLLRKRDVGGEVRTDEMTGMIAVPALVIGGI